MNVDDVDLSSGGDTPELGGKAPAVSSIAVRLSVFAVYLSRRFDDGIVSLISSFLDHCRCTICDEGVAVLLRDGSGEWQHWYLTCALSFLPDGTHRGIYRSSSATNRRSE